MRLYEAIFIIDSSVAERDWDAVASEIDSIVQKHGGKVVDLRKWDDRRLAYEINRVKRAQYVLVHFEAPTLSIETMRRDFVLSEKILRQLITVDADGVPVGDDRPGITSSAIPDFPERGGREGRGPRNAAAEAGAAEQPVAEQPDADQPDADQPGSEEAAAQ